MADKRARGRPATGRKTSVHLRVDVDVFAKLRAYGAQLETELGFTPTSNQVLRHLLNSTSA